MFWMSFNFWRLFVFIHFGMELLKIKFNLKVLARLTDQMPRRTESFWRERAATHENAPECTEESPILQRCYLILGHLPRIKRLQQLWVALFSSSVPITGGGVCEWGKKCLILKFCVEWFVWIGKKMVGYVKCGLWVAVCGLVVHLALSVGLL